MSQPQEIREYWDRENTNSSVYIPDSCQTGWSTFRNFVHRLELVHPKGIESFTMIKPTDVKRLKVEEQKSCWLTFFSTIGSKKPISTFVIFSVSSFPFYYHPKHYITRKKYFCGSGSTQRSGKAHASFSRQPGFESDRELCNITKWMNSYLLISTKNLVWRHILMLSKRKENNLYLESSKK